MSSSEPFSPASWNRRPPIGNDEDLEISLNADPDILEGTPEDEPDLSTIHLRDDLPIRKPSIGEQLTPEQLQRELEGE